MNIAIILAGGTGSRLGAKIPKQYIEVEGRPIISHCLELFAEHERIDGIQIVADEIWRTFIQKKMNDAEPITSMFHRKFKGFSNPGINRQTSILHSLEDVRSYAGKNAAVIIHDAVRPFVTKKLISHCLDALMAHEGAVPILPVKDTLYYSDDKIGISSLLDRSRIFAGQSPEAFRLQEYYEANRRLLPDQILEISGSSEPAVMAGMDVAMIPGDEDNFKITTQKDLEQFKTILEKKGYQPEQIDQSQQLSIKKE